MRLLFLIFLAAPAFAEDPKKQLDALADELAKVRSQLPAAIDAVHSLENRLDALQHQVERLSAQKEAAPFVQSAIDELRTQIDALERRLASTQARVAELPAFRIGYDDGVYLETQPVRLQLNASIMPRYIGAILVGKPNSSGFELHHAQLALGGDILGWIDFQLMLDFGAEFLGDGNVSILRDAYIDVRPLAWLRFRGGQFKVPYSRQRLVSSLRQTFTDRSLATRAFSFDRDLGGMLELAVAQDRFLIQVAITDGVHAGPTAHNDNLDFAYTLRLLGQPLGPMPLTEGDVLRTQPPRFSIGAAFNFDLAPNAEKVDLNHDGVIDNVAVYSLDVEAALKCRGVAFEGEYFLRVEQPGAGLRQQRYQGGYAQLSYMIWRGLQAGARYSFAQPHLIASPPLGIFGDRPRSGQEASLLLSYFVWRQHVRAQLEYDYRRDLSDGVQEGHLIQVQVQAGF
jgi:hypothetical protein